MKYIILSLLFCFSLHAMARTSIEVDEDYDDGYYYQENVWYGPGLYNGVWFSTEIEFNNWHNNHYHNYHHHGSGGHGHRGDHHGGGGHGHGGGHHGGGGHGHGGGGHH